MIRLLVCGSRTLEDKQNYIEKTLDNITKNQPIECVISGMARGADIISFFWANQRGIKVLEYPADWKNDGRAAGPIRNKKMLNETILPRVQII
jgi:hypothetical protein